MMGNDKIKIEINKTFNIKGCKHRCLDFRYDSEGNRMVLFMELETTKNHFTAIPINIIEELCYNYELKEIEDPFSISSINCSELHLEKASYKKKCLDDFLSAIENRYELISYKKPCQLYDNALKELSKSLKITTHAAKENLHKYLQSGKSIYALVDRRAYISGNCQDNEKSKDNIRGPFVGGIEGKHSLVKNDDAFKSCCEYIYDVLERGKGEITFLDAYDMGITRYYSDFDIEEFKFEKRKDVYIPSKRRVNYYILKNITGGRNLSQINKHPYDLFNNRFLRGMEGQTVLAPGDIFEMDEVELGLRLVRYDQYGNRSLIGLGVFYMLVDVYSRLIVGAYCGVKNNSYVGLCNAVESLFTGHSTQAEHFGYEIKDKKEFDRIYPSCVLPAMIRCDQGSEYTSKDARKNITGSIDENSLDSLGISIQLVPTAAGSMKGIVESNFNLFKMRICQATLAQNGYVTKKHFANEVKDSTVTIETAIKIMYEFILYHNSRMLKDYPYSKRMIENGCELTPVGIWEYGVQNYGAPVRINPKDYIKYKYNILRSDKKFRLDKKGLNCEGLRFVSFEDRFDEIMNQYKGKSKMIKNIRYDENDCSHIYIKLKNGDILVADCVEREENIYAQSWTEYAELRKTLHTRMNEMQYDNDKLRRGTAEAIREVLIEDRKLAKETDFNKNNVRENRKIVAKERAKEDSLLTQRLLAEEKYEGDKQGNGRIVKLIDYDTEWNAALDVVLNSERREECYI